jgi:hypothetical protein
MQVGDLIREIEYPNDCCALIIAHKDYTESGVYLVLCYNGRIERFQPEYIEEDCEVISSASR